MRISFDQFLVCPSLSELTVDDRIDPIGVANGGQPVADDDSEVLSVHRVNPGDNRLLGGGVKFTRRLVEQEDIRVG